MALQREHSHSQAAAEDGQQDDEEFDKYFIVFDGSSPEDVSHAKQLWSSVSLQPPLESRLVSSDIRQRLPVARPHLRDASGAERGRSAPETTTTTSTMPHGAHAACIPLPQQQQQRLQIEEEKRRYLAVAIKREEILSLMQKRREQRIQKEMLARAFKPKMDSGGTAARHKTRPSDEELEMDKDIVQQLR